jgi:hypothetical protein
MYFSTTRLIEGTGDQSHNSANSTGFGILGSFWVMGWLPAKGDFGGHQRRLMQPPFTESDCGMAM